MVYCSNCGSPIADEANFCPKCGTRTQTGTSSNVSYPHGEIEDAFYRVGTELERAFTIAARETEAALKRARESMKAKSAQTQSNITTITCPSCGNQNINGAIFCNKCGTKLSA